MNAFADNIVHFARILRHAGVPLGTGQVNEALRAVAATGIADREVFRTALFSTLVTQPGQRVIFDQAFAEFWRDHDLLRKAMASMLPQTLIPPREPPRTAGARRVADAMRGQQQLKQGESRPAIELDARETMSAEEILSSKDFEQMTSEEINRAKSAMARLNWHLPPRLTRRTQAASHGAIFDIRRTLRKAMKTGGDFVRLEKRRRQKRQPPLVILCDISGSMSLYARMCLHFFHGLTQSRRIKRAVTHTFLFGTGLTNITRALRLRDPDEALAMASTLTPDWDGGTRIADSLDTFNRLWSRRVLGQGAIVLLITDGLERDNPQALEHAAALLHRSTRRLIWLNPLLRYDAFAPRAQGIKILIRHVDEMRPVHSLQSIADLAQALGTTATQGELQAIRRRAA